MMRQTEGEGEGQMLPGLTESFGAAGTIQVQREKM